MNSDNSGRLGKPVGWPPQRCYKQQLNQWVNELHIASLSSTISQRSRVQDLLQPLISGGRTAFECWRFQAILGDVQGWEPASKTGKKQCTCKYGYGSIPIDTFLVGRTSIYQLFWGSLGTRVLTHPHIFSDMYIITWVHIVWSHANTANTRLPAQISKLVQLGAQPGALKKLRFDKRFPGIREKKEPIKKRLFHPFSLFHQE